MIGLCLREKCEIQKPIDNQWIDEKKIEINK